MRCSFRIAEAFCWQVFVAFLTLSFTASLWAAEDDDYLRMQEGREWIHDVEISLPDGRTEKATGRSWTEGKVVRNGITYNRNQITLEGGPFPFKLTKLVRKDEKGVYTLLESEKDAGEQMEVKFPLKVGTSWQRPFGGLILKESIVGVETITIGETTYENCVRIQSVVPDGSYAEEYWEAPNVGCVKSKTTFSNGVSLLWTLREFKPGKP